MMKAFWALVPNKGSTGMMKQARQDLDGKMRDGGKLQRVQAANRYVAVSCLLLRPTTAQE